MSLIKTYTDEPLSVSNNVDLITHGLLKNRLYQN